MVAGSLQNYKSWVSLSVLYFIGLGRTDDAVADPGLETNPVADLSVATILIGYTCAEPLSLPKSFLGQALLLIVLLEPLR